MMLKSLILIVSITFMASTFAKPSSPNALNIKEQGINLTQNDKILIAKKIIKSKEKLKYEKQKLIKAHKEHFEQRRNKARSEKAFEPKEIEQNIDILEETDLEEEPLIENDIELEEF